MKNIIKRNGLILGVVVGFFLGLFLGPLGAFSSPGNGNEWEEKFIHPLLWTAHHIKNNYIEEVTPEQLLQGAYYGIVSELDKYSAYIPEDRLDQFEEATHGEFGGLGIQITFDSLKKRLRVEEPIPGTPAFRQGVMANDIIVEIYDYPSDKHYESVEFDTVHDAVKVLRGEAGTKVRITVVNEDTGKESEYLITREIIEIPGVQSPRIVDENWNIGYIYVPTFHERTIEDLQDAVKELQDKDMQGLILDFRFNPGGLLSSAVEVSDMFMEDNVVVTTKGRTMPERIYETETEDVLTDAPLIVLVNQYSASASEIFAGAVKDNKRGLIVGETTFGKGSVQSVIPLQNRAGALKLTTAAYYTPSGVSIEDKGIEPHIEIVLTDEQNRQLARKLSERDYRQEEEEEEDNDAPPSSPPVDEPDEGDEGKDNDELEDVQLLRAIDAMKALLIMR